MVLIILSQLSQKGSFLKVGSKYQTLFNVAPQLRSIAMLVNVFDMTLAFKDMMQTKPEQFEQNIIKQTITP